ncbi:MAG: hypothetical protein HY401_06880 [Elusimicrobia bacterium]|nr:hypothetical protein [Elusimicrobiota bacterium]
MNNGWIVNRRYDSILFILFCFIGLLYGLTTNLFPGVSFLGNSLIYLTLGLGHFGATWLFYLDSDHRAYFHTKRTLFFYIPGMLVGFSILLAYLGKFEWIQIITYWFSGFHVMKQSTGLANLYRFRAGISSRWDRLIDEAAILGVSTYCLFKRCQIRTDFGYEYIFQTPLAGLVIRAAEAALLACLILWAAKSFGRFKSHGAGALPLFLINSASLALFLPFVYVNNFVDAFMASLMGHYAQYLGLTWLIQHQKYRSTLGTRGQSSPILAFLSQNVSAMAMVLLGYGVFVTACSVYSPLFPAIGLTWAHFFVDRYLFRFRDPYIRAAILPYLKGEAAALKGKPTAPIAI